MENLIKMLPGIIDFETHKKPYCIDQKVYVKHIFVNSLPTYYNVFNWYSWLMTNISNDKQVELSILYNMKKSKEQYKKNEDIYNKTLTEILKLDNGDTDAKRKKEKQKKNKLKSVKEDLKKEKLKLASWNIMITLGAYSDLDLERAFNDLANMFKSNGISYVTPEIRSGGSPYFKAFKFETDDEVFEENELIIDSNMTAQQGAYGYFDLNEKGPNATYLGTSSRSLSEYYEDLSDTTSLVLTDNFKKTKSFLTKKISANYAFDKKTIYITDGELGIKKEIILGNEEDEEVKISLGEKAINFTNIFSLGEVNENNFEDKIENKSIVLRNTFLELSQDNGLSSQVFNDVLLNLIKTFYYIQAYEVEKDDKGVEEYNHYLTMENFLIYLRNLDSIQYRKKLSHDFEFIHEISEINIENIKKIESNLRILFNDSLKNVVSQDSHQISDLVSFGNLKNKLTKLKIDRTLTPNTKSLLVSNLLQSFEEIKEDFEIIIEISDLNYDLVWLDVNKMDEKKQVCLIIYQNRFKHSYLSMFADNNCPKWYVLKGDSTYNANISKVWLGQKFNLFTKIDDLIIHYNMNLSNESRIENVGVNLELTPMEQLIIDQ